MSHDLEVPDGESQTSTVWSPHPLRADSGDVAAAGPSV